MTYYWVTMILITCLVDIPYDVLKINKKLIYERSIFIYSIFLTMKNSKGKTTIDIEKLTDEQIKIGIFKAIENTNSLIIDANILYHLQRYPRAFALFQFSNEEIGKAFILSHILLLRQIGKGIDYKKYNKEIKHHQNKHRYSVGIDITTLSAAYEQNQINYSQLEAAIYKLKNAQEFDTLKNQSLYIDLCNDGFKTPFESIKKELVDNIKEDAEFRNKCYSSSIQQTLADFESFASTSFQFEKNADETEFDFVQVFSKFYSQSHP